MRVPAPEQIPAAATCCPEARLPDVRQILDDHPAHLDRQIPDARLALPDRCASDAWGGVFPGPFPDGLLERLLRPDIRDGDARRSADRAVLRRLEAAAAVRQYKSDAARSAA